jgi:hypothetical protein
MPGARFSFELLSPVEKKPLLVLCFPSKPLILALTFALNQCKWNHQVSRSETYSPSVMGRQLLFLRPGTRARDFPICILMKLEERDRISLCIINRIDPLEIQERADLGHKQFEAWDSSPFGGECVKRGYCGMRLEAKLGVPRCEMGPVACQVEFDFVICFQHLTWFCIAWDLGHVNEFLACSEAGPKTHRRARDSDLTSNTNHASACCASEYFVHLRPQAIPTVCKFKRWVGHNR